jgi:hypothetical protein
MVKVLATFALTFFFRVIYVRSIPNMMRPTSNQILSNEKENVEK